MTNYDRDLLRASLVCVLLGIGCLLLIPVTAHCKQRPLQLTLASYAVFSTADLVQTTTCLNAGTCREANPMMEPVTRNRTGLAVVKVAATAGVITATWKLRKTHPRLALWLGVAMTSAQGFAVWHNAKELRGRR